MYLTAMLDSIKYYSHYVRLSGRNQCKSKVEVEVEKHLGLIANYATRAFWVLEKTALCKNRVSGTVVKFHPTQFYSTNTYIS